MDDILASEGAGGKRLVEADSQVVGCGAREVEVGRKVAAGEEIVGGRQDIGGTLDVEGERWVALQVAPQ